MKPLNFYKKSRILKLGIRAIIVCFLVAVSSVAQAGFRLSYSGLDSSDIRPWFHVEVYDLDSNSYSTQNGIGWGKFQMEVVNGDFDGVGGIYFDRGRVYDNGNILITILKNYTGQELSRDTIVIPLPDRIKLNYKITPGVVGERLILDVYSLFPSGHISTTQDGDLRWKHYILTCRGQELNPYYFFIPYFVDSPEFVILTVSLRADSSLKSNLELKCNYSHQIRIDLRGKDGVKGRNGRVGFQRGMDVKNGERGQDGANGDKGEIVNVVLVPLESDSNNILKILFYNDYFVHYIFLNPGTDQVLIDVSGGDGGMGGNGGKGADGDPKKVTRYYTVGGNGGEGGYGGKGGDPGRIILYTNQAGWDYLSFIKGLNKGGKGGIGGYGGQGGITYLPENAGFFEKLTRGKNGRIGDQGMVGMDGENGFGFLPWEISNEDLLNILMESDTW